MYGSRCSLLEGCGKQKTFLIFLVFNFFLLFVTRQRVKSAKKHTKLVYIGTTYLKTSVEESYGYVIFFILLLFKYGSMTTIVGMNFEYKIMVCFLVENEMFKWKTKQRRKNHRKFAHEPCFLLALHILKNISPNISLVFSLFLTLLLFTKKRDLDFKNFLLLIARWLFVVLVCSVLRKTVISVL